MVGVETTDPVEMYHERGVCSRVMAVMFTTFRYTRLRYNVKQHLWITAPRNVLQMDFINVYVLTWVTQILVLRRFFEI